MARRPHDEIYLQLFAESAKDIHMFLLNKNVVLDMSESPHFKGARYDAVETASFLWKTKACTQPCMSSTICAAH